MLNNRNTKRVLPTLNSLVRPPFNMVTRLTLTIGGGKQYWI